MKNYIINIKTKGNPNYDLITMAKVLCNVVAFSGDLYSIDYEGIEHGIFTGCENNEYFIEIIINELEDWFDVTETIDEITTNFTRYGIYDSSSRIRETSKPTEIPDNYIEHYYVSSYNID